VTEEDVDARNVGIELAMWGIGAPFNELVGLVLAATTGLFNRRMSDLPGLTVGDNELRIATFNPGGSPDDYYGAPMTPGVRSGYEYTFRNGQAISSGGYYYTIYIPHRPFRDLSQHAKFN